MSTSTIARIALLAALCATGKTNGQQAQPGMGRMPHRQDVYLSLDPSWVASHQGAEKVLIRPQKHPSNPIIVGDKPWAPNPYCFGSAIYDEEEKIYKLWYQSYTYNASVSKAMRAVVLYATSQDGVQWDKPALGVHAWEGDKRNNMVLTSYGYHDLYSPSVIKDLRETNPQRRYKMVYWDFVTSSKAYVGGNGMCVAFSPDGIHWTKYEKNPVMAAAKNEHAISDVMSVMQDPVTGKFIVFAKGWASPFPKYRMIVRSESSDFINWSKPEPIIRHAHNKEDPQSYGMSVSYYRGVYLGLLNSYKSPGNHTIDIQLWVSSDTKTWSPVVPHKPFLSLGGEGEWDDGMIFSTPVLMREDTLKFYYGGWDGDHNSRARRANIGLATTKVDRLAAWKAVAERAEVVSLPVGLPRTGQFWIRAKGDVAVELCHPVTGQAIQGYEQGACAIGKEDEQGKRLVTWKGSNALSKHSSIVVRLILKEEAEVYSFGVRH